MSIDIELENLQQKLRQIRESQGLTLQDVATKSKGAISAIALGSYERGDRSISTRKIMQIAHLYGLPIGELFNAADKHLAARVG